MKDLRKNQETLIANAASGDFSFRRFISKWGKVIIASVVALAIIVKPHIIATVIGNWVTSFLGTLCETIRVEGVSSFNLLLTISILIIVYTLVNRWIMSKNTDKVSGRGNSFS
jgi:hypothetical protein